MPLPTGSLRTRITSVTSSATVSQVFLPAATVPTSARLGMSVFNDSTAILYLKLGNGPASTTNYTVQINPSGYYEAPYNYAGEINGIWASASGAARITEYL